MNRVRRGKQPPVGENALYLIEGFLRGGGGLGRWRGGGGVAGYRHRWGREEDYRYGGVVDKIRFVGRGQV